MSYKVPRLLSGVLILGLAACQSNAVQQTPFLSEESAANVAAAQNCDRSVNDTLAKVESCIQRERLWRRLTVFQRIADANPGSQGHGNRDTGTPGYRASVAYVAKVMRRAGYDVRIQQYVYTTTELAGTPQFRVGNRNYALERDWFVARGSGTGDVDGPIQPANGAHTGCSSGDYAGFRPGNIALLARGPCDPDLQVENAQAAGAAAVILYNMETGASQTRLMDAARIPVVGAASNVVGNELESRYESGSAPTARIEIRTRQRSDLDYNVIADSKFGDPNRIVVIDAHLDAIYGAGMLDNASGSTTILEIALAMAKTPTRNRLRYMWFGGEELGLLGSRFYTTHLAQTELRKIAFDVDADVTATPNFDILIADPGHATKVKRFPKNVVPQSQLGNDYFYDFFKAGGIVSRPANFGNNGTDSFAFSLVGVPNTGILTQQDCCKHTWETQLWGGVRGNYEGKIPSFNGGCVDYPHRWCDNLSNNDPFVLELASKATAYVTFELANRARFPRR
ncbi:MAG: M28 family peptidase [Candidatus Eremiobacteraeota bacterium]|nr:M28 family peptidase [Candidatus Eremiobacteraeota bacterium]